MITLRIIPIIVLFFVGCRQLYTAGNLVSLGYPVNTPLNSHIISQYLDTLIKNEGYAVPRKWAHHDKLVNLDSNNHKRVYFKNNPEEMYLLSFGGMLVLNDVFNPSLKQGDWVAERSYLTEEEVIRIKERFKKEILDKIETMAKRDGLPDSLIYWR